MNISYSSIVYGVLDESDQILEPEWLTEFYNMDVFINSFEKPVYGIECTLDVDTGFVKIIKNKDERECVSKFMTLFMEKFPYSKVGYYTCVPYDQVDDKLLFETYVLNEESESDESESEESEESESEESEESESDESESDESKSKSDESESDDESESE